MSTTESSLGEGEYLLGKCRGEARMSAACCQHPPPHPSHPLSSMMHSIVAKLCPSLMFRSPTQWKRGYQ